MAAIINTNIQSMNAQRNLSSSQASLSTAMQRLSSGLRINSAKDDAAGLAISERMTTQTRGLTVAARNASDGISLAQTAEGALGSITSNLQRIRELAVQSRNATNNAEDRAALDEEVQQLKEEIGRVARDTSFNGTNLLDGTFTDMAFQVGANQGQTIDISTIVDASIDKLGEWKSVDVPTKSAKLSLDKAPSVSITGGAGDEIVSLEIAGVDIEVTLDDMDPDDVTYTSAQIAEKLDAAIAAKATELKDAGVTVSGTLADRNLVISNAKDAPATITLTGLTDALVANGTVAAPANTVTVEAGVPGEEQGGFKDLSVKTAVDSDNAILAMDAALASVNSARATLGAVQSRFQTTIDNLNITNENLTASKSRIMDADFAAETARLSAAQVLQQAGTAMVAQANQVPQTVLQLLQG